MVSLSKTTSFCRSLQIRQSHKVLNHNHRLLPQIVSLVSFSGRLTTRNNRNHWSPGGATRPFAALELPIWRHQLPDVYSAIANAE